MITSASSLGPGLIAAIAKADLQRVERSRGFDAIVVGAGASGGLAARELTAAGLEVLVLDAGWRPGLLRAPLRTVLASLVRRAADPRLQSLLPPVLVAQGIRALRLIGRIHQPVQARCYAWQFAPESFVCDRERPYATEDGAGFNWYRAEQLGGKMIVPWHGRQYYRLAAQDLRPSDGLSPRWPISFEELTPWYEYVEDLLGVGGEAGWGIPASRQIQPTAAEREALRLIHRRWPGVRPTIGRSAPPLDALEQAAASERLYCRQGAVVSEVLVDAGGVAYGVNWIDRKSRSVRTARAPLIFLCASTLESTRILLTSTPPAGPIGARSGALGRYLMDHALVVGEGAAGPLPEEPVESAPGRCVYVPRLDLRDGAGGAAQDGRGHGAQLSRWSIGPGRSYFSCSSFAEMLPYGQNRVTLDRENRDGLGLPTLRIHCRHGEAELRRAQDQAKAVGEIGNLFGVRFSRLTTAPAVPGSAIHECGSARMGEDPGASVLDPFNQCWDARGLYVTDGAAFPSQGVANPTLTIMALTARACANATGSAHLRRSEPTGRHVVSSPS